MTARPNRPPRLVAWWVERYTATAPEPDGADRRAEVHSDLHEQLAAADRSGVALRRAAMAIGGRTLRGVPADIAWRLGTEMRPGRLEWHLAHPSVLLGFLLVLLVPTSTMLDAAQGGATWLAPASVVLVPLLSILGCCALGFAAVAAGRFLLRRSARPGARGRGWLRRAAVCWMSPSWAAAGLWRFDAEPLEAVAALAWAGFGVAFLVYAVAIVGPLCARFLDLGKLPS